MQPSFSDLLGAFLHNAQSSANRVAKLSGVPKQTISNWLEGRIKKPHQWQPILKVAIALHLSAAEINQLLKVAGHPDLNELRAKDNAEIDKFLPQTLSPLPASTNAPFQALPDLPKFVGRQFEINAVKTLLLNGANVAICSFRGMGGVGKTTLATHLAYQMRQHFCDGVLWAQLDTTDTMSILGSFASALGYDVSHLRDVESRSAALRGMLSNKRMLLILDNATTSEQVRPLLPPTPGSTAAIITTRNDLVIGDATHRFNLAPFSAEQGESLALLEEFLGEEAVSRNVDLLMKIAERLGHLPLAVSIAASKIQQHFQQDIAAFWEELQQAEATLSSLDRIDHSIRLSFDLSYNQLKPEFQQFFNSLGVFGGEDFSVEAATYVMEIDHTTAARNLRVLCEYSLVQPSRKGRYRLHPLLRDYANEHLASSSNLLADSPLMRMLTYYAAFAEKHSKTYEILETELSNFLSAYQVALQHEASDLLLRQSIALFSFLELRGLYDLAEEQMRVAEKIAVHREDEYRYSLTIFYSAIIQMRRCEYYQAIDSYNRALKIAYSIGDLLLVARIEKYISAIHFSLGNYADGEVYARKALSIAQTGDDAEFLAETHIVMGGIEEHRGEFDKAEYHHRQAMILSRQVKSYRWLAIALINLGETVIHRGDWQEAESLWTEGLEIARSMNYPERISSFLIGLAGIFRHREELEKAESYMNEAITIARQINHRWMVATGLIELGAFYLSQKQLNKAESSFSESNTIAREIQTQHHVGNSLYGLAQIARAANNPGDARRLALESLEVYDAIGYFRADEVRQWLITLEE